MDDETLRWAVTAAFLAVAGYCVVRLVAANRTDGAYPGCHRAVDTAHVLMAVGMAAMASPVGGPLPVAGWQAIFLLLTAWFVGAWWLGRGAAAPAGGWHGGGLHHAVAGAAMVYMLTAGSHGVGHHSTPWMPGHVAGGMAWPGVGWAFVVYFVLVAGALVARTDWRTGGVSVLRAPRLTAACQTWMALGNGYLLLVMLGT